MSEKILFLTGKLAERQLRRILSSMKPEFSYKINQIGVNVAALMSENIIMRRLNKEQNADRIIVPVHPTKSIARPIGTLIASRANKIGKAIRPKLNLSIILYFI